MNQITKMMMDSNKMLSDADKAEGLENKLKIKIDILNVQVKILNSVVQMHTSEAKNKRAMRNFERMNLMDGTTAIDLLLGDPEVDKVKCPLFGKIITRAECLDLSGTAENVDHCSKCEIGIATKERLLPE